MRNLTSILNLKFFNRTSFKRFLTSIWLLGLVIAIPVILLLPGFFHKYKLKLENRENAAHSVAYRIFFKDLNGNGIKQKIYAFGNSVGQLCFQYYGDRGEMVNQINFKHDYSPTLLYLFFGDVNKNGKTEVYGFTMSSDSLFLNWIELLNPYSLNTESLFIARVGASEGGKTNFSINRFGVDDLDADGNKDIVFSIISGYSKYPRMVVIYHPDTGKLIKSKDEGMNPYFLNFYDLNRDRKMELLAGSSATFNLVDSDSNRVADIRPYLIAYDSELNDYFNPVPFASGINNHIQFYIDPQRKQIVVFQFNRSRIKEKMIGIFQVDFKGHLRDSVFLPEFGKRFAFQVFLTDDGYHLYTGDKIVFINSDLEVKEVKEIENSNNIYKNPFVSKGVPEYITTDFLNTKICVYAENLKFRIDKEFPDETIKGINMDTGLGENRFLVQTNAHEYTFQLKMNLFYYLKFPLYVLIYLLSVSFLWLIQRIREKQLHERYELQNQFRDLEIKYLRMQMDPHFMFNAFTTMALMIKNGDRETAFDSFMKFTRMLRSNFDFSDFLTRPLSEELQTVSYYLEINKLRFKDKLNYEIKVAEDIKVSSLIPKMSLQIHVENSLKHGLSQLEKPGMIKIEIYKSGEYLCMSEEDNGIGRQKAASLNRPSTKQGIKMLLAIMDRLNQHNKLKITQTYIDLADENGNPAGTRVDIRVPLNLKE